MKGNTITTFAILIAIFSFYSCTDYSYPVPTDGITEYTIEKPKVFETWTLDSVKIKTQQAAAISTRTIENIKAYNFSFIRPNIVKFYSGADLEGQGTIQHLDNGKNIVLKSRSSLIELQYEVLLNNDKFVTLKLLQPDKDIIPGEYREVIQYYSKNTF